MRDYLRGDSASDSSFLIAIFLWGLTQGNRVQMALKDPNELLKQFDAVIGEIGGGSSLSPERRRRIANDLAEVYNYVSATSQKPSPANAIHATSARNAKLEAQLVEERKTLREHQQFVENNFDKAEQHLSAIQLGGYAVFFALWSLTKEWLHPAWAALAAVLIMVSAGAFVVWEVWKATLLAFAMKRHASISAGRLEDFMRSRVSKLMQERSAVVALARSRATFWLVSVLSAAGATGILLWQWLAVISRGLFHWRKSTLTPILRTVPSCDALRLVEASGVQLAKSGCCSHHGGVCNCDRSAGRQVCCDGSYSPSCGC